ncbi:MAG: hypothetical protein AB1497_04875 [Bacillota bacterium]
MNRRSVLAIILCLALLLGGAGCGKRSGTAPSPVEPGNGVPSGTSQFPDKPPQLSASYGPQHIFVMRAASVWVDAKGETQRVQETLPPADPPNALIVEPGKEITFGIKSLVAEPARATIEVWNYWSLFGYAEQQDRPVHSEEISSFLVKDTDLEFRWVVPEVPSIAGEAAHYGFRIKLEWETPHTAEAVYYGRFQLGSDQVSSSVRDTVMRFFEACWEGNQQAVSTLLTEYVKSRDRTFDPYSSPLSVNESSRWDLLLWKSDEYTYKLASKPKVEVQFIGPQLTGPYAEASISYRVEVTERESKRVYQWDFNESYSLQREGSDWLVHYMHRSGTPWYAAGGTKPGWNIQSTREGSLLKLGPFTSINLWFGCKWSDDNQVFAFTGENFGETGLWAVRRDGSGLRQLISLGRTLDFGNNQQQYLQILDWAPGKHSIRFMINGYQVFGPHANHTGFWVAEVHYPSGEVTDIAFIPAPRSDYMRDLNVTKDRTNVIFRRSPDLWRVNLTTGAVTHIHDDMPSWDGLFVLHYSPCGWYGAHGDAGLHSAVIVYDLKTGEKREITVPGAESIFFSGWTPDGLIAVSVAYLDEIVHGEVSSWPAGASSLRFYDVQGNLKMEVIPPSSDPTFRIGPWAWTDDGTALAFTVGPLVETGRDVTGIDMLGQDSKELWLWRGPGTEPRKLSSLSGIAQRIDWVEDNSAVEVWYRVADDFSGPPEKWYLATEQTGVKVGLDGTTTDLVEPLGTREMGETKERSFLARTESGVTKVVARDAHGREEVLIEGRFGVYQSLFEAAALAFVADPANYEPYPSKVYLYLLCP